MNSCISVIIPFYNSGEFLENCIDSVLNQTINELSLSEYENILQIILIDNGSTDNSGEIAKNYAKNYENVEYHHINHQGFNHCLNYGADICDGDYISFLDSKDMISPYAYERMFHLAKKNESDLATGFVCEFDYAKCINPNQYAPAFFADEATTLKDNPNILYDSLLFNKLIKRSFFTSNDFKFSEEVSSADESVVLQMQNLADSISIINEPCYYSRIPLINDFTRSIDDKLSVMRLTDKYIKDNAPQLEDKKQIKRLKADLMKYIDNTKNLSEKESEHTLDCLKEYVEGNIDPKNIEKLNEFDKMKYEFLLSSNYRNLFKLFRFLTHDLPVSSLDENCNLSVENEIFNDSKISISKFIKESPMINNVIKVFFKKGINIEGYALVPGLKNSETDDRQVSFYLYNGNTHKKIKLNHKDIKPKIWSQSSIPYKTDYSYDDSGYRITIPYKDLFDDELNGENRILMNYKQDCVEHNLFLGFKQISPNNFKATHSKGKYFLITHDLNNDLVIDVSNRNFFNEKIAIEDDNLCIFSKEFKGNLFLDYRNPESQIPLEYNEDKHCYMVKIDSLLDSKAKLTYENGELAVHKKSQVLFLNSKKGQIVVDTKNDFTFDISKYEVLSVISDIAQRNSKMDITVDYHCSDKYEGKLKSVRLYFKNEIDVMIYDLCEGKTDSQNKIRFTMDLSDEDITANITSGIHFIKVAYDFDDIEISTPAYASNAFKLTYEEDYFSYIFSNTRYKTVQIQSKLKWPDSENTSKKRQRIAKTIYRLMRLLPIKNKQIMFESMWGRKYSCNPRYIYEYIDENLPDWKCIWSLRDEHRPIKGNGIRVRRNSLKYFYYLATSKYLINNGTFFENYVKRKNQVQVQTMHATPYKTLGMDSPGNYETEESRREYIKNTNLWDYITIQGVFTEDKTKTAYGFENEHLRFGYPRTDILFTKNNEDDIRKIKEKFGIPLDKKVILYAPTWRAIHDFELMLDLDSLQKSLSDEYVLIIRMHHVSSKDGDDIENGFVYDLSNFEVAEDIFLISDILITDYSSVMFDYALLDRPILLFTYDLAEYTNNLRGLYFDLTKNNPGPILFTSKEVEEAILNIDEIENEYKPCREKFKKKFLTYECGNSSEKIMKTITKK